MNNIAVKDVYLKSPDLSDDAIIGYNVGIRPFRKSGVRIELEKLQNKLIVHNYGYGGSGLTLCWGGAQHVKNLLEPIEVRAQRIAILGAGVAGLSTAFELLNAGYQVTIYADKFSPYLTSNVAAGIFSYPVLHGTETEAEKKLLDDLFDIASSRYLANFLKTEFQGLRLIDDYIFSAEDHQPHVMINEYKKLALEEAPVCVHFDNGLKKRAIYKKVFGLDGSIFINDLIEQLKYRKVAFINKHFTTANDIKELSEEIIINCTSIGSRELFNDTNFLPVRGQLIYFKPQPGINYSTYESTNDANFWVKLYPWHDRIILNGVYEPGEEECHNTKDTIQHMLNDARRLLSSS